MSARIFGELVDDLSEVEIVRRLPAEVAVDAPIILDRAGIGWFSHGREFPRAACSAGACERLAAALMYFTVTGERSSRSTRTSIIAKDLQSAAARSASRNCSTVVASNPSPPQSRASCAYGHGGISSSSRRSAIGRKMPHPPLLISTTIGFTPLAGAWEISGPVI